MIHNHYYHTTTDRQSDWLTTVAPHRLMNHWVHEVLYSLYEYNTIYHTHLNTWTSTGPTDLSSKRLVKDSHVSFSYRCFFYSDWTRSHCSKLRNSYIRFYLELYFLTNASYYLLFLHLWIREPELTVPVDSAVNPWDYSDIPEDTRIWGLGKRD